MIMGQAKKQYIKAHNGERCWYCGKVMTEEELKKVVLGTPVMNFKDGTVGCADCIRRILSEN